LCGASGLSERLLEILRKVDLVVDQANQANITVSNIGYGIDTVLMPKIKQLQDFDINAIIYNVGSNSTVLDFHYNFFLQ
jgi:hypothetical protein